MKLILGHTYEAYWRCVSNEVAGSIAPCQPTSLNCLGCSVGVLQFADNALDRGLNLDTLRVACDAHPLFFQKRQEQALSFALRKDQRCRP
jgi:hypothetical protein